jgi:hypothetical protein
VRADVPAGCTSLPGRVSMLCGLGAVGIQCFTYV